VFNKKELHLNSDLILIECKGPDHMHMRAIEENRIKKLRKETDNLGPSMFWLTLMITALFFCLPLGRFSIAGVSSDFRIYDFMFIIFLLFVGLEKMPKLEQLFKNKDQFHRFA